MLTPSSIVGISSVISNFLFEVVHFEVFEYQIAKSQITLLKLLKNISPFCFSLDILTHSLFLQNPHKFFLSSLLISLDLWERGLLKLTSISGDVNALILLKTASL